MHQKIRISDLSPIGTPGPLPYAVAGWSDADLRDLSQVDLSFGLAGMAFWPVIITIPTYDATKQVAVPPANYTVDAADFRVTGTATVRGMTADEFAAANPVPDSVTNYQARAVLVSMGKFDTVDQGIRASGNQLAIQAWDYANNFYRTSAFIASLGPGFGFSNADLDTLFRQADQVQ